MPIKVTKLCAPQRVKHVVSQGTLVERLDNGLAGKLTPFFPTRRLFVPALLRGVLGAPVNSPAAFEVE
ncbi:MAG: hypothetical protein WKG52_02645 [Variovorax sp.]